MMAFGNTSLLEREKIGFLASRRVPPEAVMRCLDWATRMRDEGVCVMSGFQSPLEKEVLNILLKGTSPLILASVCCILTSPRSIHLPCGT